LKRLNKKLFVFLSMPRSRRLRKNQNQSKPEWGKNNPQSKANKKKAIIWIGIITVAVALLAAFLVVGQGFLFSNPTPSSSPSPSPSPTKVLLETSMGNITLELRVDKPITTQNFVNLVQQGLYDNTVFHRVLSEFMIQGGKTGTEVAQIQDEIGNDNNNYNGTIAMAKTSAPNSATSEFFINVDDNSQIEYQDGTRFDATYTTFGKVISGMDVVMKISQVETQPNAQLEKSEPVTPVTLIRATVTS
jgi:cyclophilin family peptidyl-prolyl cis-trans isomerase